MNVKQDYERSKRKFLHNFANSQAVGPFSFKIEKKLSQETGSKKKPE